MKFLFGNRVTNSVELRSLCANASTIARSFDHDYVGVEHMFLAMRNFAPDHIVIRILTATQIDLAGFWAELESQSRVITGRPVPQKLPFTPRVYAVLRLAQQFARLDSADTIEVLHLVFAVAHERKSLPAVLLAQHHAKRFPEYDGHDMLSAQLVSFLRFDTRPYLALSKEPQKK